ncbi:hypothetical protein [Clostridium sp. DJ247]|uniref:hypothetical protein n=1 Tax=Clostridium sp. DJ247 TaxID=2726188 RepID=UPI00162A09E2|nr:hypothetical protein [Clostridium sp. DJ247]MBC2579409.1 hypothetical protein [Clostridium sp. DJ247]
MTKQKRIDLYSYKYISSLVAQLLELDIDTEEKITGYIENFGIDNFLKDIELMDLPYEILEKLESLEQIIEALEEENEKNGGVI